MTRAPAAPGSGRPGRTRPPLSKRLRPWHWLAIDVVVGLLGGLGGAFSSGIDLRHVDALHVALLIAGIAIAVPVALRRRWPRTMFWAIIALAAVAMLGRSGLNLASTALAGSAYVLYLVAATYRRRTAVTAMVCALAAIAGYQGSDELSRAHDGTTGVPLALLVIVGWYAGHAARQRRLYVAMLQEQAADTAVAEERLRIARELHDVVAHSMSLIAVQAGYGRYVIDTSPDGAKEALDAIAATSRDALEEMRRMLGVLRQESGGDHGPALLVPESGLGELGRLIERTTGAGVQVTLRQAGTARELPVGIDLSAYRVIQESLTNVIKHAGSGARCDVALAYGPGALTIEVTDDGGAGPAAGPAAASTGHGLIGMRERVALCGGDFSASPGQGRGFRVYARFPLSEATPPGATPPAGAPPAGAPSKLIPAATPPPAGVPLSRSGP